MGIKDWFIRKRTPEEQAKYETRKSMEEAERHEEEQARKQEKREEREAVHQAKIAYLKKHGYKPSASPSDDGLKGFLSRGISNAAFNIRRESNAGFGSFRDPYAGSLGGGFGKFRDPYASSSVRRVKSKRVGGKTIVLRL